MLHRWECVACRELKTKEAADGVHYNVAEYDGVHRGGTYTFTFDKQWGGHNLEICCYHYPKQALNALRGTQLPCFTGTKVHILTQEALVGAEFKREYAQYDSFGVPTHTADGKKINAAFRKQLAAQVEEVAARYPKILLGRHTIGLEWFRQAGSTASLSLFNDSGKQVTNAA
jgi:hypothetical protein